ncbi:hypothetical protein DM02DRAFT_616508 [Periconia macrospinosa]|uniref:Uncharacterized protein n=1 Tax=Periconia macrospinosa TaxID=97972 RepID=A0A2V1DK34_9PLEO|nr:hypothetical protein DM02DRAFT_616508 [Periconia macrospinosa]
MDQATLPASLRQENGVLTKEPSRGEHGKEAERFEEYPTKTPEIPRPASIGSIHKKAL